MASALDILQSKKLRVTTCRIQVLKHFLESNKAVSHQELEAKLVEHFDRVTIYRTLHTYLEADIIHQIPDSGHGAKYALCEHSTYEHHDHNHIHFKCLNCQGIECLFDVHIHPVLLPSGFEAKNWNFIAEGICAKCNKQSTNL